MKYLFTFALSALASNFTISQEIVSKLPKPTITPVSILMIDSISSQKTLDLKLSSYLNHPSLKHSEIAIDSSSIIEFSEPINSKLNSQEKPKLKSYQDRKHK